MFAPYGPTFMLHGERCRIRWEPTRYCDNGRATHIRYILQVHDGEGWHRNNGHVTVPTTTNRDRVATLLRAPASAIPDHGWK